MINQVYLLPKQVQVVKYLDRACLEKFRESVRYCYNSKKARAALGQYNEGISARSGLIAASSPFINLHFANLNPDSPGVLPNETILATRQEIEQAIGQSSSRDPYFFLRNKVTDFGLALVTAGDSYEPNDLLAKTLARQLEERGIELGTGKLIPLSVLAKPVEDQESAYGLVFHLNDSASKENILDLNEFDWNYGPRREGLARAYWYCDMDRGWICDNSFLAYSSSDGRIVGVKTEEYGPYYGYA